MSRPKQTSLAVRRRITGVALGTCAVLALTGVDTAAATAPTSRNPHGSFKVGVRNHYAHVFGVAADPDTTRPVAVRITFPNLTTKIVRTNARTHRFSKYFWLPTGAHYAGVRLLNQGAGTSTRLASKWITVHRPAARNPRGTEHVKRAGHVVKLSGVAWDPDLPRHAVHVRLVHNGRVVARGVTNARTRHYAFRSNLGYGGNAFTVVAVNRWTGTADKHFHRVVLHRDRPWIQNYQGTRRIAAQMLPKFGWGADQMRILDHMWYLESHWLTQAANPSGAYGIPQAYPGYKMASAGADWRTNPATQIKWGLRYIQQRYGSPAAAWNARETVGSY